jgi:hypothetical protein
LAFSLGVCLLNFTCCFLNQGFDLIIGWSCEMDFLAIFINILYRFQKEMWSILKLCFWVVWYVLLRLWFEY